MTTGRTATPITIPILVGVTGKRKNRLDELRVSEALVRTKLRRTFLFLQGLVPNSPKILLCGMADGVDEIAARLVIESVGEKNPGKREFYNWSIVGILPMPEEAFLDDFDSGADDRWWYHALDKETRESFIRLMPLQTLLKPSGAESSSPTRYTAAELRRPEGGSARTAHYEQLGLVLAERSTVLIAVMPESEIPDRPGGTAQVVSHRLNGWRVDWPPVVSQKVANASAEFVVPPPLATLGANDAWLVPIGGAGNRAAEIHLRILRRRDASDPPWPTPFLARSPRHAAAPLQHGETDSDVLIADGYRDQEAARSCSPLLRSIEAFNCRAASVRPRQPPSWDTTTATYPDRPELWSPLAAAERMRGVLSDIQRRRKDLVRRTATTLGVIAAVSIAGLELYAELFHNEGWGWPWQCEPLAYVIMIGVALLVYRMALRRSWPAVAEDYRLLAEALRVQVVWWQIGLTARCDRVDNLLLRYDTGELQLLRHRLATVLDAILLSCAALPTPPPADSDPDPVMRWIENEDTRSPGQVQYHRTTANQRKRLYGVAEFAAWSLFGISLGAATWLAIYECLEALSFPILEAMGWVARTTHPLIIPVSGIVFGVALLVAIGVDDIRSPERAFRAPHIVWSWLAGSLFGAALVALWSMMSDRPQRLHMVLFLGSVLLLAWGGILRYWTEKIAIEAEAQGSAAAYSVYLRAKKALDDVERHCADKQIDVETARWRSEQILRDLGRFALAETEAWLRSHRERPLHPVLG